MTFSYILNLYITILYLIWQATYEIEGENASDSVYYDRVKGE